MINQPKLSVIIPVYNTEEYLEECIQSVLNGFLGDRQRLEIIVVSDCSEGDTEGVLEKYRGGVSASIVYVKHNSNKGLYQARITGFKIAKGEYITSIDSDDLFVNVDLNDYLKTMDDDGIDVLRIKKLIGTDRFHIDKNHESWTSSQTSFSLTTHDDIWNWFTSDMHWAMHGTFYRRSVIERGLACINTELTFINSNEDLCFNSAFFYLAKTFRYEKTQGFYLYRTNNDSMVRKPWDNYKRVERTIESLERVRQCLNRFERNVACSQSEIEKLENVNLINLPFVLGKSEKIFLKNIDLWERLCGCYSKEIVIQQTVLDYPDLAIQIAKSKPSKAVQRIAIVTHRLGTGGAERCAVLLSSIFKSCGFEVSLVVEHSDRDYKVPSGVEVEVIPYGEHRVTMMLDFYAKNAIDTVVFIDHWRLCFYEDILMAKCSGMNVIAMEHSSFYYPAFADTSYLFDLREKIYKVVDVLTCLNTTDEMTYHALGIAQARYVPNPSTFAKNSLLLNFQEREKAVVLVGRISKLKGMDFLPSLIEEVADQIPNVKFYLLGRFESDSEKAAFYKQLDKRGCRNNLAYCGYTNRPEEFLKKSLVHVSLSKIEGSPMVIGEARSHGVPTVLFEKLYVDIAERGCVHVKHGDIVALSMEVKKLLLDEKYWTSISMDALQDLDRWSDKSVTERWKEIFHSLGNKNEKIQSSVSKEFVAFVKVSQITLAELNERYQSRLAELTKKHQLEKAKLNKKLDDIQMKVRRYDAMNHFSMKIAPLGSYRRRILKCFLKVLNRAIEHR